MLEVTALMACVLVPTSLMAIFMWQRYPRLRNECAGILVTAAVIAFYPPLRHRTLVGLELDALAGAFEIAAVVILCGAVHLGLFVAVVFHRPDR